MWRVLRDLTITLREVVFALIAQPSRNGPTDDERDTNLVQTENLRRSGPASAWDATKQVGAEIGKAAILQPTDKPKRKRP